ncbi:transposase [Escherichia coli]|nr:IS911 transposase [Escherichia coli]GCL15358.1 IS911 transposase [Escherichia coli]SQP35904.1 transposase [Escherichia coli]SQP51762.1 transposase [Escherichia coli]
MHRHNGNPVRLSDGGWLADRLMKELGLISCQQPSHRYRHDGHEHVAIPNYPKRAVRRDRAKSSVVWIRDVYLDR